MILFGFIFIEWLSVVLYLYDLIVVDIVCGDCYWLLILYFKCFFVLFDCYCVLVGVNVVFIEFE